MSLLAFLVIACIVLVFIVLLVKLAAVVRPRLHGEAGESFVSSKLFALDPKRYAVLNNLMLPSGRGERTTQIDHVVVSNFGVFCIETKGSGGKITGNAEDEYWTQTFRMLNKKIYNPLRQNRSHARVLEAMLRSSYPSVPVISFVVFTAARRLEISGTNCVGSIYDIIRKMQGYTRQVLSDYEVNNIRGMLMRANITDPGARRAHIAHIQRIKASKRF